METGIKKEERVIALAGNPNVGKSTVFNSLTGMHQHTGNWPGKTVARAEGYVNWGKGRLCLVDLPGTYSLMAHSREEEIAGEYICFGDPDAVVVVCDASCLERNLLLVLQILEITDHVIVCVNLMDEAKRKKISIDLPLLSSLLGVPAVGTAARNKKGLTELLEEMKEMCGQREDSTKTESPVIAADITCLNTAEAAIYYVEEAVKKRNTGITGSRWLAVKLLDGDLSFRESLSDYLKEDLPGDESIRKSLEEADRILEEGGLDREQLKDILIADMVHKSEEISRRVVNFEKEDYSVRDRRLDGILTNKWTGIPIMLLLLLVVFWITISGANYPSRLLSEFLFGIEDKLMEICRLSPLPPFLYEMLLLGVYRVVAWVVSVMLPPMAIFFPLFTLLEDAGYLPRIAFNLDHCFKRCSACGKQALTMCMGFGCNAAGVVGCRIIDSPRERLIAIITNSFVPCNGRFPTLIAVITMFFVGFGGGLHGTVLSSVILTVVILFGVIMTFLMSKLLSLTILKGIPSSFTLELPPYRRPQAGRVIVRSIFDRTLFVLGRAVAAAAPAGLLIWLLANIHMGDTTILSHLSSFMDPAGRVIGLDGVILLAFILGLPANEIVIPIILMSYLAMGSLQDFTSLSSLKEILVDNGWTWITAVSMLLFSLMHWPCATTCMTIKKETQSLKWTAVSFLLPAAAGFLICFLFSSVAGLFVR